MLSSLCTTTVVVLHLFWELLPDKPHRGPSDTWFCMCPSVFQVPLVLLAGFQCLSQPVLFCSWKLLPLVLAEMLPKVICVILSFWSGVSSTALARTWAKHDLLCCLVMVFKRNIVLWLKPNKLIAIKWLMDLCIATRVSQEQINRVTHRRKVEG